MVGRKDPRRKWTAKQWRLYHRRIERELAECAENVKLQKEAKK